MKWLRNLSLKFKLIFLLVFLTGTMLSVYGLLALRDFERDKIAYVLDSGLAHARSSALQIHSEVSYVVERVRFLMRGYDYNENKFHPFTNSIFPSETQIESLHTYALDVDTGEFALRTELRKTDSEQNPTTTGISEDVKKTLASLQEQEIAIRKYSTPGKWLLGLKFTSSTGTPLLIVSLLKTGHFLNTFDVAQMQDTFLMDAKGDWVMSPNRRTYNTPDENIKQAFQHLLIKMKSPEGTLIWRSTNSDSLLVSMASLGFGNLKVASIVPESAALEAVKLIMIKSALFLLLLLFVTIFLSVLSSMTLTASLKKLLTATKEIAKGNFTVFVDVEGQDEIGSLSQSFNKMALEIERLMEETAEKARMEGELKTAQLVQSTLFPKEALIDAQLEIRGFYQPASECSGDWWYYTKIGGRTLFCIGDATGHGVPAALLTAAARSAASALESFPNMGLGDMMGVFNRAIYNTANGQVMMTLFLGLYDHESGKITYACASHEPPYLLPNKAEFKRKDILLLNDVSGPRLGETPDSKYETAQVEMGEGDKILFYTDGVTELKNQKGEMWGERALIKCLVASVNEQKSLEVTMDHIAQELTQFRENYPLQDDVTYFMLTRSKSA